MGKDETWQKKKKIYIYMYIYTYILKRAMLDPSISGQASGMKLRVTLRPHRFHSPNS